MEYISPNYSYILDDNFNYQLTKQAGLAVVEIPLDNVEVFETIAVAAGLVIIHKTILPAVQSQENVWVQHATVELLSFNPNTLLAELKMIGVQFHEFSCSVLDFTTDNAIFTRFGHSEVLGEESDFLSSPHVFHGLPAQPTASQLVHVIKLYTSEDNPVTQQAQTAAYIAERTAAVLYFVPYPVLEAVSGVHIDGYCMATTGEQVIADSNITGTTTHVRLSYAKIQKLLKLSKEAQYRITLVTQAYINKYDIITPLIFASIVDDPMVYVNELELVLP